MNRGAWLATMLALAACRDRVEFDLDATTTSDGSADVRSDTPRPEGGADVRTDARMDARTDVVSVRDGQDIETPPDDVQTDVPDDTGDDVPPVLCVADPDCSNSVFCDGVEHCVPGDPGADARGCVASTTPACTAPAVCDENGMTCTAVCPDADGDGVMEASCGGMDCNDGDPAVHPGAGEVCNGVDDDCNMVVDDVRAGVADSACTDPSALALDIGYSCARGIRGPVYCWGDNTGGELGCLGADCEPANPTLDMVRPSVVTGVSGAISIAAGEVHVCATSGASAHCWGESTEGALGDPNVDQTPHPEGVTPVGLNAVSLVGLGPFGSCAVDATGTYCWGRNDAGQLGMDTGGMFQASPVLVTSTQYISIDMGDQFACGVRPDGVVECWGAAIGLGDGSTMSRPMPGAVPGITGAVEVAVGASHACARTSLNELYCWGDNTYGQLGLGMGGPAVAAMPMMVAGGFAAISAGHNATCGITGGPPGMVQCWGQNDAGQVGDGTTGGTVLAPTDIMWPTPDIIAVSQGGDHACLIDVIHRIYCWGNNDYRQLGNGTTTTSPTPVPVFGQPVP